VLLVALFGFFLHGQQLPWQAMLGLALIVLGVTLVKGFSREQAASV
jgi:multidrug transporter EmrE-like cation transporter